MPLSGKQEWKRGYQQMIQKLVESLGPVQVKFRKNHNIERLKSLGVTVFEGSTNPANAEAWLNMLEKSYEVMDCLKELMVRLATFMLQKEAEGWWKSIKALRGDMDIVDWETFSGIFEDKYYHCTYCEVKREEFLKLI